MSEELNKLTEEKIEELYNNLIEKPLQVLGIFNDFFGEEMVDMQGLYTLDLFKSWITITPLKDYVTDYYLIGMSVDEWGIYKNMTIYELPEAQIHNVYSNLKRLEVLIGSALPSDITILVHFPHVKVTNENNRSVDINHLWAKVQIRYTGVMVGYFTLNRSEYFLSHLNSRYLHSHVPGIPIGNFSRFQSPCLGTGPINDTIGTLEREFNKDIWKLFCLELSKYVTVESIAGRPYNYLESIGGSKTQFENGEFTVYNEAPYFVNMDKNLKKFIRYFISEKKLRFNYVNNSYSIGMSLAEYIILISNEFISWYNELFNQNKGNPTFNSLKMSGLLKECIVKDGKIYYKGNTDRRDYLNYIGREVCTFKGEKITLNIIDDLGLENVSIILNTQVALYILHKILKVLNYRYGREPNNAGDNESSKKVRYL